MSEKKVELKKPKKVKKPKKSKKEPKKKKLTQTQSQTITVNVGGGKGGGGGGGRRGGGGGGGGGGGRLPPQKQQQPIVIIQQQPVAEPVNLKKPKQTSSATNTIAEPVSGSALGTGTSVTNPVSGSALVPETSAQIDREVRNIVESSSNFGDRGPLTGKIREEVSEEVVRPYVPFVSAGGIFEPLLPVNEDPMPGAGNYVPIESQTFQSTVSANSDALLIPQQPVGSSASDGSAGAADWTPPPLGDVGMRQNSKAYRVARQIWSEYYNELEPSERAYIRGKFASEDASNASDAIRKKIRRSSRLTAFANAIDPTFLSEK